jgi:hypothetical protein
MVAPPPLIYRLFPMREPVAFFIRFLRTQTTARGVGWAGRSPTDSPSDRPCGATPVPPPLSQIEKVKKRFVSPKEPTISTVTTRLCALVLPRACIKLRFAGRLTYGTALGARRTRLVGHSPLAIRATLDRSVSALYRALDASGRLTCHCTTEGIRSCWP